ncbi:TBC1 domain family member 2B-like [Gigantopelta aegis]|uniref:TBC1 domain family member 2B-like n=1 Tax=Gigantopelta aegis TaxID=1735272 RepID=UPI001B88BDF0|nr:TBC1 domain family member 2B-like [Gigantopelta aegis]
MSTVISVGNSEFYRQEENRLCGWLIKVGAIGFMKTNKLLWFVYGDDTCKLYYYRNPQDLLPLGEIDISNAYFNFDASVDKPGLFEIRSDGKVHLLDAQERSKMIYWLQELQKKRREFSQKRTSLSSERVQWIAKKQQRASGLVGADAAKPGKDYSEQKVGDLMPDLCVPVPMNQSLPSEAYNQKTNYWSLQSLNLTKEIRNAVSSIKSQFSQSDKALHPQAAAAQVEEMTEDWTILDPYSSLTADSQQELPPSSNTEQTDPTEPSSPVGKTNQGKFLTNLKKIKFGKRSQSDGSVKNGVRSSSPTASLTVMCSRCRNFEAEALSLKEDLASTDNELSANRQIVKLLQKEINTLKKQIQTQREAVGADAATFHEMLRQRDKLIIELQSCLSVIHEDKNMLSQQSSIQQTEVQSLKEQVIMYQEMLGAKDEVIMQLTHQVFEHDNAKSSDKGSNSNPTEAIFERPSIIVTNTKETEALKDACQAYELQNKFLTKEILELNQLRQHDEAREKILLINYAHLEAEFYKTRSRYLFLLKEIQMPVRGGDEDKSQDVISQLLQEALDSETQSGPDNKHFMLSSSGQECDRYGFYKVDDVEDDVLTARAQQLEKESTEITNKLKDSDETASHHVKWENFLVGQPGKTLTRSQELKLLVRSGVPHEYREQIWKGCIEMYVGEVRDKLGPHYYKSLVERAKHSTGKSNPAAKQIELDLLRTLPHNRHFISLEADGVKKLRQILLAYSAHNPVIGYCQGLNRLAAIALLFLCEEEAFWCLVAIVEHILPQDYFTKTLAAAQSDQRVLKDLVLEKLPKLYAHLENNDVDLSLFTFNWFLTIFVDGVPPETFLRVWDAFLFEGSKVLFRFAIAFLKHAEEDILQQNGTFQVNRYMRTIGQKMINSKIIARIAFHDLNPFPMRNIAGKRHAHLQQVKTELEELDAIRQDFKSHRIPDDRLEYYSDDDDESKSDKSEAGTS